ncbi:MAG TPA: TIGR03435 family protein [Candidatus Sulfopaludibacter sp.]|jgi:uncharacterized protein (TIGR03435 family)|nr:TIGR03435 family protein [Candidatus Sulfopaludibacter sp.]
MRADRVIGFALLCVAAQGQTAKPSFEVASVKPAAVVGPRRMSANRRGGPGTPDPGTYTCENCPIFWVLSEAYDLQSYDFDGPDWVHEVRFDFAAKIPPGTTKAAFREMLQGLLAERFHLAVHRVKKEMNVYELAVGKSGPKFAESRPPDSPPEDSPPGSLKRDSEGFPVLPRGSTMAVVPGHARIRSDDQPMAWFVQMLSGQLGAPVRDATGLTGKYDFQLSWSFQPEPGAAEGDVYRTALVMAIQSQLGLKLEQKKGPVEVLTVDHLDKTVTAN